MRGSGDAGAGVIQQVRLMTQTVVEGEPFRIPEAATIISAEPIHWAMDGKTRWRIVYTVRNG